METLTARDVMSGPVLSVRADLTLKEVSTRLSEAGISGAPVVDDAGMEAGMATVKVLGSGNAFSEEGRAFPDFPERLLAHVAGFHRQVLLINAGEVGRLPAMAVKLKGVTA